MAYKNRKTLGSAISQVTSVPAPIGGLNAVSSIAAMPQEDAIIMENFFPTPYSVNSRAGSAFHATGIAGRVLTLMTFRSGSVNRLFAVADNAGACAIYDVTGFGAVGAPVVTGLTSAQCQYVNFATPATNYLYVFNGVDAPRLYDGTTWTTITGVSTPAITGVTTTKLKNPEIYKNRLFMIEAGTKNVWYLPVQSVGGAAAPLYLGAYLKFGGEIKRIVNISIGTANQIADYCGFLSSEGELLVFSGSDPASDFNLVGSYKTGRPIGDRCTIRMGSDILFITTSGVFGLTQLYDTSQDQPQNGISYKITPLFNAASQSYFANYGWQGILHNAGSKIIINVPTGTADTAFQYVMNILTGAWCKFTGWPAFCFETVNNNIYYGGNGFVAACDVGTSDLGQPITAALKPAFSYFSSKTNKKFEMIRPVVACDIVATYNLTMNYDFQDFASNATVTTSVATNIWDTTWDTTWSGAETVQQSWKGATGIGFCASPRIDYKYSSGTLRVLSFDYLWQNGGIL